MTYAYVPSPSTPPAQLPQFDTASPSLLLLPVEFPDYNNIDSIDSENVIRFGLRNTLQTRRDGQLDNLLDWNVTLDWRLTPGRDQVNLDEPFSNRETFSDLYSDLTFKPRSWIVLNSQLRTSARTLQRRLTDAGITFHQRRRFESGVSSIDLHTE